MRIVVAGGGIAGLTCALSLHDAGFDPLVLESVSRPAPLGVGINLLPHATRELAELGLLDAILDLGVEIEALDYVTSYGRPVWHEPRGRLAGYRWPQVAVHRGHFQNLLCNAVQKRLGREAIRFGWNVERIEAREDRVTVTGFDHSGGVPFDIDADIVIAADGIHSAVRRGFYPHEGRPVWNGVILYWGITRLSIDEISPRMLWAGHARQKFAGYPIAIDRLSKTAIFNWICDLTADEADGALREDWNKAAVAGPLLERYRDWRWSGIDVPAIIKAAEGIWQFPMTDRDPLPRWTHGRATLIGDAAHPMYPIGSNGATQAIIDARAIAFHLKHESDPIAGLLAYEADRRDATSQIVLLNRAHGPDRVLELAAERAPTAAYDLDALLPEAERAEIAHKYKIIAGFDPEILSMRRSYSC